MTTLHVMTIRGIIFLFIASLTFKGIDLTATWISDQFLAGQFAFSWLLLHHILQIPLALAVMRMPFWRRNLTEWGLNLHNIKAAERYLLRFAMGWILCTTLFFGVSGILAGWPSLLPFDPTPSKLVQYLLFEGLVVGISEEVVFRGLILGMLHPYFSKTLHMFSQKISVAAIISAGLFALAHIGIAWFPFAITAFNAFQVFAAFALGLFYAFMVERTGSLVGAILAHNISDLWLSILYIAMELIR